MRKNCLKNQHKIQSRWWGLLRQSLLLLSVGLGCPTAFADLQNKPPSNLYVTHIATATQSVTARETLVKQAFQNTLVKLSGSSAILQHRKVTEALKNADNFVSQFTYEGFGAGATATAQSKILKITFSQKAVNQLIKDAGHSVWNAPRRDVLVWLAVEKNDEKHWVNAETEAPVWSSVQTALDKIQLPMVTPLFDLMDETEFSVDTLWQKKFAAVPNTMQRYGVESCVLGLLREHPGGWHAEWFLFSKGSQKPEKIWQSAHIEWPDMLQSGIDQLGIYLAAGGVRAASEATVASEEMDALTSEESVFGGNTATAVKAAEQSKETQIAIAGIQNSVQYAQVLNHLKNLAAGVQVEIVRIEPEHTVFKLQPGVAKDTVLRKIQQGMVLVEDLRATATAGEDPTIYIKLMEVDGL